MRSFIPEVADSIIDAPAPTTVDGKSALQYDFSYGDSLFRYVFIQADATMFTVIAEVDAASVNPMDDISSMIESIRIAD